MNRGGAENAVGVEDSEGGIHHEVVNDAEDKRREERLSFFSRTTVLILCGHLRAINPLI